MDLDDFRTILETAGVDVWTLIDTAVLVASLDYGQELKQRRDRIVERLYGTSMVTRCRNCDYGEKINGNEVNVEAKRGSSGGRAGRGEGSPSTPPSVNRNDDDDEGVDRYGGLFDDEQKRVLDIKESLEDPDQSEDSLIHLLQSLADMDITFQALKETDIGRHVNRLRKHSSNEVKRLVKQLVRKWKETVDEWVIVNQTGDPESALTADGESPQQRFTQNGHLQVPDFGCSPSLNNGSPGSEKNNSEPEKKSKPIPPPRKDPPTAAKGSNSSQASQHVQKQQKESFDLERLASARKRLQDNYKEAENAKKQRTIRVMDVHELPKPKKAFFPKGKGGGSLGRHW